MKREHADLVEKTLDSLVRHPEEWASDGHYRVTHPSGISIWIANSYYGLSIEVHQQDVVGGVTGWSSIFGRLISWRRKIMQAALAIPSPERERIEASIAQFIRAA